MQHHIQQIIVHEDYIPGEHHDDIAIIQLTEKVLFKNDVHRVCLPEATQVFPPGEGVVVTGWGALSYNGKSSENLTVGQYKSTKNGGLGTESKASLTSGCLLLPGNISGNDAYGLMALQIALVWNVLWRPIDCRNSLTWRN